VVEACRPWTTAILRYRVTRASQTGLTFEEIPEPEYAADTTCVATTPTARTCR